MPRWLHPGAWWAWALGLAAAASRTTNPVLLASIIAVAAYVVAARRPAAAWGASFASFLRLGVVVIVLRVVFAVLVGLPMGTHVIFTLPSVALPDWAQGMRLGGPVTAEQVLFAAMDGLRLATMLACLGAANSLASPSRLLKSMPTALYEAGVAVVVAMTFAPQLVSDVARVRTAQRLRGRPDSGVRGFAGAALPVLAGALDRSITLAAAMDSRGYGRTAQVAPAVRRRTTAFVLAGLVGIAVGVGAALDAGTPNRLALPLVGAGAVLAGLGLREAGRRGVRTRYRRDPWSRPEWLTLGSGLVPAVAFAFAPASLLIPSVTPLTWPSVSLLTLAAVVVAAVPARATPEPPGVETRLQRRTEPAVERVAA